ncbi:recombination mediator RecR [soil metagenome]
MAEGAGQREPGAAETRTTASAGGAKQRAQAATGVKREAAPRRPAGDALGVYRSGYPAPVDHLIAQLAGLPGIGRRSAERLALFLLKSPTAVSERLAAALTEIKRTVHSCEVCFNLTDAARCGICADSSRQRDVVMVVEEPRDVLALESAGVYRGLYHVLLGRLSPLDGVGPDDLTIPALLSRVEAPSENAGGVAVRELILALNPTLEGDGTALYLADRLKKSRHVTVSRLARGLPTGVHLEFANKAVLADAIHGRRGVDA